MSKLTKKQKIILGSIIAFFTIGLIVTVVEDTTPPTASIHEISLDRGTDSSHIDFAEKMVYDIEDDGEIDYQNAVTLTNIDDINLNKVGTYEAIFTVTDAAGNETTISGNVNVVSSEEDELKDAKKDYKKQINELSSYSQANKDDINSLNDSLDSLTYDDIDSFQTTIDDYQDRLTKATKSKLESLTKDTQAIIDEGLKIDDSEVLDELNEDLVDVDYDDLEDMDDAISEVKSIKKQANTELKSLKASTSTAPTSLASNTLISSDSCNLSGDRVANAKVDIGYDSDYANRDYYAYTNEYSQLVYVEAATIVIQDDSEEEVNSSGRYCNDEAKVDGVESSDLDEGHVIADSLGGVSNSYNITPQESNLNRHGTQADIEEDIRSNGGATNFAATITYPDTSTQIPSTYQITYYINGTKQSYSFDNDYNEDTSSNTTANSSSSSSNSSSSSSNSSSSVYYENCTAVRDAGAAPIYTGDPGYSSKLDRDGDGVACE